MRQKIQNICPRNVLDAKWWPERLQEQPGGKKSEILGPTFVESGAPKAASGTPWASIMAPKIEKCRQKCHPEIDTEKVSNIDARIEGKVEQTIVMQFI